MKKNKILAAVMSMMITASSVPFSTAAEESQTSEPVAYTVTFLDFDGNIMDTLSVRKGEKIDYSKIDTSSLHRHIDVYTEQDFSSWSMTPETTDCDITIQALSKTAVISLDSLPEKSRYYSKDGNVLLDGLSVSITLTTQTPELDEDGNYVTESIWVDITSSCAAVPSVLSEAFSSSDSAEITIYPIGDTKPVAVYTITCHEGLGDVNQNGRVDAIDASAILKAYAAASSDSSYIISDEFLKAGDVNLDGKISANDASLVLKYYAMASSHEIPDWDKIIP